MVQPCCVAPMLDCSRVCSASPCAHCDWTRWVVRYRKRAMGRARLCRVRWLVAGAGDGKAIVDDELSAARREQQRDRAAQPLAGAGHNHDPSSKRLASSEFGCISCWLRGDGKAFLVASESPTLDMRVEARVIEPVAMRAVLSPGFATRKSRMRSAAPREDGCARGSRPRDRVLPRGMPLAAHRCHECRRARYTTSATSRPGS